MKIEKWYKLIKYLGGVAGTSEKIKRNAIGERKAQV